MASTGRVKRILEPAADISGSAESPIFEEPFLRAAHEVGSRLGVSAILLYCDATRIEALPEGLLNQIPVILVSKAPEKIPAALKAQAAHVLSVPNIPLTRMSLLKTAVMVGLSSDLLTPADTVLCLTGIEDFSHLDTLLVLDIGHEFEMLSSAEVRALSECVQPAIFQAALNLAIELGHQGREGRTLGTIFVLGDVEQVMQLSRQLIINPFKGYAEDERNILDPRLRET